jgi:transposase
VLSFGSNQRVFLCRSAVDFRKAHDGLCALVREALGADPFSGDVFAFFNRAKDRIKLLVWDRNGFWLCYKRLEEGTFPFAVSGSGHVEIERGQLVMLLEGIEWDKARKYSNYARDYAIKSRNGADAGSTR